jgi:hypothetical protein
MKFHSYRLINKNSMETDNQNASITVPDEVVMSKIYVIRKQKVMLDKDLAELYGVQTKCLITDCELLLMR